MKHIIQEVFTNILENPVFDLLLIEQYFSKDYIQLVDHTQLNYEEFILHIKKLKEKLSGQKLTSLIMLKMGISYSLIIWQDQY